MLSKDILRNIFKHLQPLDAKTARLVCRLWDTEIRKRFNVFYVNQKLSHYPEYCDEIVCFNSDIPLLTKNIKRVHLYESSSHWEFDIDTLFIYCDSISGNQIRSTIGGNITNLIIGIYDNLYPYTNGKINMKLTPQNNCSEMINEILTKNMSDIKGIVCITSNSQAFSPFVLARVVYIKRGSKIKNLFIRTQHLRIIDIDAEIESIYVCGGGSSITVIVSNPHRTITFDQKYVGLDSSFWKNH